MGHINIKKTTRHYMSVGGTFIVLAVTFFLGFIVGVAIGANL